MHPLLRRQIKRWFGELDDVPSDIAGFMSAVDAAYRQSDEDRSLLERAMELTSLELNQRRVDLEGQLAQRIQAEARLAHTVATLTATLEASVEGILVVGTAGYVPHYNRRFAEMWRIPDDVLATRDEEQMFAVAGPQIENIEDAVAFRNATLESPEEMHAVEGRLRNGRTFAATSHPQRMDGEVIGRVLSFRDITGQRRAQAMLEQLAEFPRHCPAAILEMDAQGALIYANPAAQSAFPDLMGLGPAHPVMVGLDDLLARFRKGDRTPTTRELTVGSRSYVQVIACAERGDLVIVYLHDISERVQLELQLRQAQKMEAVGQLAGGIAHDFNNLLTAILGNAQLLAEASGPAMTEGEQRQLLGEICGAAERASTLTSQLLTFSRRQPYSPRRVTLDTALRGTERILRRLVSEDVGFAASYGAGGCVVEVDSGHLDQVVVNLVVNARDAVRAGGRIEVSTSTVELAEPLHPAGGEPMPPGRYACIDVRDNGEGMARDVVGRIFEPFFTTKPQGKGTGLGLSTVFGIVKQSRGGLTVDSELGRGTTFRVYLPLADGASASEPAPSKPPPAADRPGLGRRALLVEDEVPVRRLTRRVLERLGFDVVEATNGVEALAVASRLEGGLDLLVSDVVMPMMCGPDTARELRVTRPRLAVVFMSGYADEEHLGGAPIERAVNVTKPFTSDSLGRAIGTALARTL